MIVIQDKTVKSSEVRLYHILRSMKKDDMLRIAKKLDFWVSPNVSKDKTALRIEDDMLENPESIYYCISKSELPLVGELVKNGPDYFATRKIRKTFYQVQKLGLVLTYEDVKEGMWHMTMAENIRQALEPLFEQYQKLADNGVKPPSPKEFRMAAFLNSLLCESE